jgi:predicted nucleotidyltransferase
VSEQLRSLLTELRSRFESLYGPRLVRLVLFGSQARGDAEPGSDIDVLVVLEGAVRPGEEIARTGEITAGISLENNVVISCTFISADRFEREESPLMINVRREGGSGMKPEQADLLKKAEDSLNAAKLMQEN